MKDETIKAINKAFDAFTDIFEISEALVSIIERECCMYGFVDAYKLAKKWQREEEHE